MVDLDDLTLWTAVATWGLAIGTVILLYWQTRQTQKLNSANAVIALRERFDSPRMRRARQQLSREWLNNHIQDLSSVEVLTFFELVGAQTQRGILDEEMVWEAFGGWVTTYFWAMRNPQDRIVQLRETIRDPLVFFRLEWLNNRIIEIDRRNLGSDHLSPQDSEVYFRQFLQRESMLTTE